MIELRDYQVRAVEDALTAWHSGARPLLAMATGTGKTETALGLVQRWLEGRPQGRCLWISHRRELVHQVVERVRDHWPELQPATVYMGPESDPTGRLVSASIQTLHSRGLGEVLPVDCVVVDEAHHAAAPTYRAVLGDLPDDVRVVGLTATPRRADGQGLTEVFDTVAARISVLDAIEMGALVPFAAYAVEVPVSLAGVEVRGEDWDEGQLAAAMDVDNVHEILHRAWAEYAGDRQTMIFVPGVRMAYRLAEYLQCQGVSAEAADGTTRAEDRDDLVRRYREGQVQVLVNCALWTEGFDAPATGAVVVARPTRSDTLYLQMVGRALRLWPGKSDAVIIDLAPQDARDLFLAGDLLGRPRPERRAEARASSRGVLLDAFSSAEPVRRGIDADPNQIRVRLLEWATANRLQWTMTDHKRAGLEYQVASAGYMGGTVVVLAHEVPIRGHRVRLYNLVGGRLELLGRYDDVEDAMAQAERFVRGHPGGGIARRSAAWRRKPATARQRSMLARLGVPATPEMTRGQASQAIGHAMAIRAVDRLMAGLERAGIIHGDRPWI